MLLDDVPAEATGSFSAIPEVIALHDPTGVEAESIRALRTKLISQVSPDNPLMLAVCGPNRGAGSTFVAVNLAVATAQAGIRTLLIDADMREPGVQDMIIPSEPLPGLQQYLRSEADARAVIQEDVQPDLSILYAGGAADQPQELLSSNRFKDLLKLAYREYDLTIVDTPPANKSADSRLISAVTMVSLVVARCHHTFVDDVKTLAAELAQNDARVVGTILNDY